MQSGPPMDTWLNFEHPVLLCTGLATKRGLPWRGRRQPEPPRATRVLAQGPDSAADWCRGKRPEHLKDEALCFPHALIRGREHHERHSLDGAAALCDDLLQRGRRHGDARLPSRRLGRKHNGLGGIATLGEALTPTICHDENAWAHDSPGLARSPRSTQQLDDCAA